jgi:hypothetical protein
MRTRTSVAIALACAAAVAIPPAAAEAAAEPGPWKGRATSKDGTFRYGKVTFRVRGRTIRNLKIESVTVGGCGGLGMKSIVVPKLTITGRRFRGVYKPVPDVDDTIIVTGTISGGRARGTFTEGPLCSAEGKFTARAA